MSIETMNALDPNDPRLHIRRNKWLMQVAMARAARAREDVEAFFEFVMLEETTRQPIKLLPHQKVSLKFMVDHDRSVNILPVGHGKTYGTAGLSMFFMGQDPTLRGAIVSATSQQAEKPLSMVADYIQTSPALRVVFPQLRRSRRRSDAWTQTEITIDRPPGIRDASLMAVGLDSGSGKLPGARLNWVIVDDILNYENTASKTLRDKTYEKLDSMVLSRLDPANARLIFTNTPFHPDDIPHRLEKAGWATMRMDILGGVQIQDDREKMEQAIERGVPFRPWTHPELRPASRAPTEEYYRLRSHDPDPKNEKPLWVERYPLPVIEKLRRRHLPQQFNQLYMGICRDDATAMCKREFVDLALKRARDLQVFSMVSKYRGPCPTFTGVDLAISPGEEHDDTAFFTFMVMPDGTRVLLDAEAGQWDGPSIIKKLFEKQEAYDSIIRVESNAAQDYIRQFALAQNKSLPIKAHMTGRAKAHPEHGVASIFLEMANGAWAFPNRGGEVHPQIQRFIDACLYYQPGKHTDDLLMAAYMAREQAKAWGVLSGSDTAEMSAGSLAMSIMAR